MRQTLLRIPIDADWWLGFGLVPGFGFGLVLVLWILAGGLWFYLNRKSLPAGNQLVHAVLWGLIAVLIIKAPDLVQRGPRAEIAAQSAIIEQPVKSSQLAEHYLARGRAYEQVYEYQNAIEDYKAAIEVAPEADAGHLQLAWLYATCPNAEYRYGEKAVELAQAAFDKAEVRTAIHWDTLGAAHAAAGDFAQALRAGQTAATSAEASADPQIRGRLPDIRARIAEYRDEQLHVEPRFAQTFPQSLPVRGYGFLMFLGFLAAVATSIRLASRVGISADVIWDIGIWGLLGGIVCGRLFYLVQYHERVFEGRSGRELLLAPFELQEGGLVLLGGLLGGSAVFLGYCAYRKLKPLLMADIAVPGFFAALAFGRLGCLMNGCCYGDRCELPWAIQFPLGSVPDMALVLRGFLSPESLWSMPLHPSQIYSSVNALILAFLTATYFRYRSRDGEVLAMGMLTYPVTRFAIEYLRGDEMGKFGTGFTISQLVSLGLFAGGLVYLFWLTRRPRQLTPAQRTSSPAKENSTHQKPVSATAG